MKGFFFLLANEIRLLHRQKVFAIAAISTLIYAAGLYFVPKPLLSVWLPAILFSEVITMGVLFIAGMIFLEKKQNTIVALAVTPLPTAAWLLSKSIPFTLLTLISAFIILLLYARNYSILPMLLTILLSALLYNHIGLLIALLSEDIRNYFLPLSIVMGISGISIYAHLGLYDTFLYWVLPSHPAMLAISGATKGLGLQELALNLSLLIGWNILFFLMSRRVFSSKITTRIGR